MKRVQWQLAVVGAVGLMVACSADERTVEPACRLVRRLMTRHWPAAADFSSRRSRHPRVHEWWQRDATVDSARRFSADGDRGRGTGVMTTRRT
jgi:hypothetical protein